MHKLLTRAWLWFFRGLAFGPKWLVRLASGVLGELGYRLAHYRRKIAFKNLALCFPEMPDQERRKIARAHFHCYARVFIDRFALWFGSAQRIEKTVLVRGWEHFAAHDGKPIILFAPHFLGLEAGGMRFQLLRRAVNIYSRQSNKELDAWVLRGRKRFNDPILLVRSEGVLPAIRWLKRGVAFHFSPDMDLGRRESVFVPFFGVEAATVTSMVRIARLTGAVVVPLVTRLTSDGYEATFYPGWTHPNDDQQETIEAGARRMNAFIEARILEAPEQYLWTHRRFKTRPPGVPSVYA
jgi:Kdo2-lipid IVA lauroyltransferase/acyltransferase